MLAPFPRSNGNPLGQSRNQYGYLRVLSTRRKEISSKKSSLVVRMNPYLPKQLRPQRLKEVYLLSREID